MREEELKNALCKAFCGELSVREVPAGLAFSGIFEGVSGDRISGYVILSEGLPYLSDDGSFLADLDASGVDIENGARAKYLQGILSSVDAYIDPDTLTIRTQPFNKEIEPHKIVMFLSALMRAQDVTYWNRERIRNTFAEDFYEILCSRFGKYAHIKQNAIINQTLSDFPTDILLSPKNEGSPLAIFLAQNAERLNEATLLAQEMKIRHISLPKIAAVSESGDGLVMTNRKVSRALNRIDGFIIFNDDEEAAIDRISKLAEMPNFESPSPSSSAKVSKI